MQLILIELNELNFEYAKKYFDSLKIDNIKKINKRLIYTESEESYELLEPWIQWHSIHTGYLAKEHGILRLGDAINSKKKQIFEELEDLNLKVGAVSAMNTINNLKKPSYFIPDPWTNTKSDNSFFSKIITSVLKDTVNNNATGIIPFKNYFYLLLIFFKFVRLKKYFSFIKIFFSSFFGKWRKALFLDLLIHEIHLSLLNKHKTDFSCVFFNAGAHIQHHYLLNSLENLTNIKNPKDILRSTEDPFKEALIVYDNILQDYLDSKNNIIIATGLTQQIVKNPHYYYRLLNHEKFLKKLNIIFLKIEPRMSRDFLIHFSNNIDRDIAHNILRKIYLKDQVFFGVLELREKSIFATLSYNKKIYISDRITLENKEIEIFNDVVFVALKNGEHNGRGFLFTKGEIEKDFEHLQTIKITQIKEKIENFFIK